MRSLILPVTFLVLVAAAPLAAQSIRTEDTEAGLRPRLAAGDADFAMHTRRGDVTLLLHTDTLFVQFTDRGLDDLRNGAGEADRDDDRPLIARVIAGAFRGGLVVLMDRAVALHVSEVDHGEYERGRLRLLKPDGDELFDITINDRNIMEDFSERDARRFLDQLESAKRRAVP